MSASADIHGLLLLSLARNPTIGKRDPCFGFRGPKNEREIAGRSSVASPFAQATGRVSVLYALTELCCPPEISVLLLQQEEQLVHLSSGRFIGQARSIARVGVVGVHGGLSLLLGAFFSVLASVVGVSFVSRIFYVTMCSCSVRGTQIKEIGGVAPL